MYVNRIKNQEIPIWIPIVAVSVKLFYRKLHSIIILSWIDGF